MIILAVINEEKKSSVKKETDILYGFFAFLLRMLDKTYQTNISKKEKTAFIYTYIIYTQIDNHKKNEES